MPCLNIGCLSYSMISMLEAKWHSSLMAQQHSCMLQAGHASSSSTCGHWYFVTFGTVSLMLPCLAKVELKLKDSALLCQLPDFAAGIHNANQACMRAHQVGALKLEPAPQSCCCGHICVCWGCQRQAPRLHQTPSCKGQEYQMQSCEGEVYIRAEAALTTSGTFVLQCGNMNCAAAGDIDSVRAAGAQGLPLRRSSKADGLSPAAWTGHQRWAHLKAGLSGRVGCCWGGSAAFASAAGL